MPSFRNAFLFLALTIVFPLPPALAEDEPVNPAPATDGTLTPAPPPLTETQTLTLAGPPGTSIEFTGTDGAWRWSRLITPTSPDGVALTEQEAPFAVASQPDTLPVGWALADQTAEHLVFESPVTASGLQFRRIYSFGPATNIVRVETAARSPDGDRVLTRAGLLKLQVADELFNETGPAPFSFPAFGRALFVGIEHVSGTCRADGDTVELSQTPHLKVGTEWTVVAAAVVGWPLPTEDTLSTGPTIIREAFFRYLDTIRLIPRDLELHTNTWWTLPLPFSEQEVIRDIDALQKDFADRTGMFFDSFALDLGWSNPNTVWRVDAKRFPNELRTITARLAALKSSLGLWVSPGSAYPEGLDNQWLESAGYEMTPFGQPTDVIPKVACMALGGRYQKAFKESIVAYARTYGLRHVKLDFMAHSCDVASHGHPLGPDSVYAIDAGLADVLDSLRAVNPTIALEPLCTGYPPSPWWTTKTPYVLGPYGDDVPPGRVSCPEWMETLITARDIAYRTDQARWIMPTQAVETIDIVVQSPGDFENLAVMAIGRGRWFISTYLKPEFMTPKNWDFFAALVRWARANKQYLRDTRLIGGNPVEREAYGYMAHNETKDIFCARNPWIEARTIFLPADQSVRGPRDLRMIYPRRETVARLEPGSEGVTITLAPYETVMLETVPAVDGAPLAVAAAPVAVELTALPSSIDPILPEEEREETGFRFYWNGALGLPAGTTAELCILVEGSVAAEYATGTVFLNNRTVKPRITGNAGQFSATGQSAHDSWTWLIVPVAAGTTTFNLTVSVPDNFASIGVFLRGSGGIPESAPSSDGAPFPLYHDGQRAWSHTLHPATLFQIDPPAETEAANPLSPRAPATAPEVPRE